MRFGALCSGIEAPAVAWRPLGWEHAFAAEIDPFCCALLAEKYPEVPNYGDVTRIDGRELPAVDVLIFGSPCQSFSVAGRRAGLADPRGVVAFECLRVAAALRPRWLVLENVPGLLSSNKGRDFAAVLGALAECGFGFAYRVLDAQHFGVPQRRRRVFVVGYLGDWRPAAAVLFEPEGLFGDPAPSGEAWQGIAPATAPSLTGSGRGVQRVGESRGQDPLVVTGSLCARTGRAQSVQDAMQGHVVAHARRADGFDASEDGTGRGTPLVVGMLNGAAVRRLTPVECERLQGFPDHYTAISYRGKSAADGPRYRALGNSMAVPVIRWLGERIQSVERGS